MPFLSYYYYSQWKERGRKKGREGADGGKAEA